MKPRKINMNKLSGIIFMIMSLQMTFGERPSYIMALITMITSVCCLDAE